MAKTGSFIKLDRGLKKNALWLEKPFSKGQAWVDLLLLAQGLDMDKHYRGKIQHQEQGTVYTSIIYLTNRWGWSRNKVYRFLKTLQQAEMVKCNCQKPSDTVGETNDGTENDTNNGTTNGTIISIVNWEVYQYCDTNNDTKDGTRNGTQKRTLNGTHNRKHIRESNKEKAIKNIPPKSPTGGLDPSGGKQWDNLHAETMMPRDMGTYEDIPSVYRDGTYQSFKTWEEYWDWSNQ